MTAISDFLPKYPNIEKREDTLLNPYGEENFYQSIFQKKEFYDERLPRIEPFPEEKGMLMKHQKLIARYLSSNTLYDQLLLLHSMGSGKTCSAIGAIEQIKRETNRFDGAIIIANGKGLLDNFKQDLMEKCTSGEYIPEDFEELTEETKIRRINKSVGTYYEFKTFDTVAKEIKQNFKNMKNYYSNKIIVIDEVHNIQYKKLMTKEEKKRRRDKLKKGGKEEKDDLERYQMFKKILHNISNSKVLLLSGTPMRDGVEEIAAVMNLILPENNQMIVKEEFNKRYINKDKDGSMVVKPDMIEELKKYFKGRVSFISSMKSDVKKEFIGKKTGGLNHLIVKEYRMSEFQTQSYSEAYNLDMNKQKEKLQNGEISEIKSGVWSLSSQAILFVYPDRSYGEKGFNKYIEQTIKKTGNKKPKIVYKLSKEFKDLLMGGNNKETLMNISKYGVKYSEAIIGILNGYENEQCVFLFNNLVRGSGAILLSLLLELFGYSRASGKEGVNNEQLRYILMTGEGGGTTSFQQKVKNRFNQKDNIHGKIIQVIIGSTLVSEGFSFSHIQQEYILTPYWNYTQTSQAIARGYRLGSHNDLIEGGLQDPIVYITQMVAMPDNKKENDITSIDFDMYKRSEDKDITIRRMLRILMESSFDCALAYDRNKIINGKNGSRDCDYTNCDYVCDGINMNKVIEGINPENLDYSTYQLYYIKPQMSGIHKKLLKLFKKYDTLTMETIIEELTPEFTERDIKNALQTIKSLGMDELDYNKYKTANIKTSVQYIINLIEELFQTDFQLHLNQITNSSEKLNSQEYKKFEIITSLQMIINENIIIKNKYGFPSYLRENNNIYFLVNNLSVINDVSSEYYTKNPNIIVNKSFDILLNSIYMMNLPSIISYLCSSNNKQYIRQNLTQMPLNIQEIFIEYALSAQEQKIEHNIEMRNVILEYFSAYIQDSRKLDPPMWISTLLQINRCFNINTLIWSDCSPDISIKIKNKYEVEIERLRSHPSGYYGFFDPTLTNDKGFTIISLEKERIAIENALKRKKSKKKKNDMPDDDSIIIDDGRLQNTGLVCKDWKVEKLLKIIIWDLKIEIPSDYQIIVDKKLITSKQDIIDIILKETKILDPDNKRFKEDQLQLFSLNELRRILHWGASKKNGGVNNKKKLCDSIYKWLFDRNQIYEKSKKDTVYKSNVKSKVKPVKIYNISIIDDNLDKKSAKFKEIQRVIGKLTLESALFYNKPPDLAKPKRFVLKIPGILILIYDKKKIIGFVDIDEGFIQNISITDSHVKKGNASTAIKTALCRLEENPPIYLTKTQDILKKYYLSLGFYISSVQEDGTTVLLFKC